MACKPLTKSDSEVEELRLVRPSFQQGKEGIFNHPPREEIQRCDAYQKFDTDQAALEAVVKAAESQPALLKFVEEVAPLKYEGEPGDDRDPFEHTSEDSIATLNQPNTLSSGDLRIDCQDILWRHVRLE